MLDKEKYNYRYAQREDDGYPIHIDSISKEHRHDFRYYCYGCGKELFPVLGDEREHHFRHEKGCTCDPNRYLHEFAKSELKKRFDEGEEFVVQYHARQICEKAEGCGFREQYNWPECEHEGLYSIDLKKHYDTCTTEKGYYQDLPNGKKKYIADLILTNSKKTDLPPICLEVWVTHECTEEKKQNGGRIIEIKINDEKDIARPIVESDDENLPIRFFNFKDTVTVKPGKEFLHIKLMRGLKQLVPVIDITSCSEGLHYDPKGLNEIILSTDQLSVDLKEDIYAIHCNKRGIVYPRMMLCESLYRDPRDKKYHCANNSLQQRCPCVHFKYSNQKGDVLLERNRDIIVWTLEQSSNSRHE